MFFNKSFVSTRNCGQGFYFFYCHISNLYFSRKGVSQLLKCVSSMNSEIYSLYDAVDRADNYEYQVFANKPSKGHEEKSLRKKHLEQLFPSGLT